MSWPEEQKWVSLWREIGASGDPLPWYEKLSSAYREPHRRYHNQDHIADCLAEFEQARHLAQRPVAVELALWFHDAVYNPKAGDNEEQSAALAHRCLTEAGVSADLAEAVGRLVMATKRHEAGADPDAPVMIDVDLSILGRPEQRFLQYEAQIRQEYSWVPGFIFKSKRAEILEQFFARNRIFQTDWFHEKYEDQARRNLEVSIRNLRGPSG
jgi:predicted metal-dependent HD superfamily phosphohydrolase